MMGFMSSISVQEIQSDPDAFLRRIEAGESLLVVRDQQPVAEVKPVASRSSEPRPFGLAAGQFVVPPEFDERLSADILHDLECSRHDRLDGGNEA
jgi:antitoxin (DNA-binding transcriptional repressor) of toxin-antitoxin stability system